jgi:hypothetical protein
VGELKRRLRGVDRVGLDWVDVVFVVGNGRLSGVEM